MHFIFVYFVRGGFLTKIKCILKAQCKSKNPQRSVAVQKFHAYERSEVPKIKTFSAYEIFWIYRTGFWNEIVHSTSIKQVTMHSKGCQSVEQQKRTKNNEQPQEHRWSRWKIITFSFISFQSSSRLQSHCELWSILVVRLAHSADLRSRLRKASSAPSVAYSTGCSRVVTHHGTNSAQWCLTLVIWREQVCHCRLAVDFYRLLHNAHAAFYAWWANTYFFLLLLAHNNFYVKLSRKCLILHNYYPGQKKIALTFLFPCLNQASTSFSNELHLPSGQQCDRLQLSASAPSQLSLGLALMKSHATQGLPENHTPRTK